MPVTDGLPWLPPSFSLHGPIIAVLANQRYCLDLMALKFIEQHAIYNRSSDQLRFFATDGGLSLTFVLSRKILDHLEGSKRVPEAKLLAAFERHKDQIRLAAARAYLETGATREAIAISPEHFAR